MNIQRWLPSWYLRVAFGVGLCWLLIAIYYATGAAGFKFETYGSSATFDFKRGYDFALLELTPRDALLVERDGSTAIVTYAPGPWCFFMCGIYDSTGTAGDGLRQRGDWLYWAPLHDGDAAVNLATGEIVQARAPEGKAWPPTIPELAAKGLTFSDEDKVDRGALYPRLRSLSVQNESCWTWNAAFLLWFAVMLLMLPFVMWRTRRRGSRSPRAG